MSQSGFEEIQHTADWALRIWAPDLPELFRQAGLGMNALMGLDLEKRPTRPVSMVLAAEDVESLLVEFLNEVVYYLEIEQTGFSDYSIRLDGAALVAELDGCRVRGLEKPIKAVTFHNLAIETIGNGVEARLVFDV
ncbi:MAG: archease [Chloroflexota bacterium]|jgi:SHS2 domain-containing protein